MKVERHHHVMLSVWFFIGLLLTVYGFIILFIGIRDFHRPSTVLLAGYHAPLWGGLLLLVLGITYLFFNWPGQTHKD